MGKRFTAWAELIGKKYGRWTILSLAESNYRGNARFLCRCDCGTERVVLANNLRKKISKSCGCYEKEIREARIGPNHWNWQGGRHYHPNGYVIVNSQPFPGYNQRSSTAFEHHVVMARHLGRPLRKDENVHHKNGIRDDNRIENLELWTKSQPAGKRVEDMVKWAKEFLLIYEPEALK